MSAARLIFTSGPAQVELDRSGRVTSVVHSSLPDLNLLTGASIGSLRLDGELLTPPVPEVLADVDEIELVYDFTDRLRVVVRHAFAAGWGVRIAFSHVGEPGEARLVVEGAELVLEPQPGAVGWGLALGATGAYSVSPATGQGPLLGGVLRRGSVDRVTERGLQLSRLTLQPGTRLVHQLQWDWYPTPQTFGRERYPDAPSALFVTTGDTVTVRVSEDVAVVAPGHDLQLTQTQDRLEVTSDRSGTFAIELRSARGTTAFNLQWVAPVEEALNRLVSEALARPRTAAGVVKLAGVAEALAVQNALARNQVDDPEVATEALDLFTARLVTTSDLVPLAVAYLSREYDRLGDPDLLAQAVVALLAHDVPTPGVGMAATQLCLALIVSGRPVEEVLTFLLRLADSSAPPEISVSQRAAQLELRAVTHAGPGIAGTLSREKDEMPQIAALGLHLGAGLKGQAVRPLPVDDLSHLITVFQLLPDGLSARLRGIWGCSAQELARRATPELLARLEGEAIGDAHAWLLLALQTG